MSTVLLVIAIAVLSFSIGLFAAEALLGEDDEQ